MVNNSFVKEIADWLADAESGSSLSFPFIEKGALLLLRANHNKAMYNYIVKNSSSNIQVKRLIFELKKHHRIALSGVTLDQVEQMKPKVEAIGKDVAAVTELSDAPSGDAIADAEKVRVMVGKRADHDKLPADIQALYVETYNILRKERALHEQLKLLEKAAPCDRHELTLLLVELDTKRLNDWKKYDGYQVSAVVTDESAPVSASSDSSVSAKDVITARSMISKHLSKLIDLKYDETSFAKYIELRDKLQLYYNKIIASGGSVTDKLKVRLEEGGIKL